MDWGRYVLFVLPLLLVTAVVAFGQVLAGHQTWAAVDYHAQTMPATIAAARELAAHQWPFWWEGLGLGVPLLERASNTSLYPFAWLGTSPLRCDLLVIAHLIYLGLGTALWSRQRGANDVTSALWGVASLVAVPWLWLAHANVLFAWSHVPWLVLVGARFGRAHGGRAGTACAAAVLWALMGLSAPALFVLGFATVWLGGCAASHRLGVRWAAAGACVGLLLSAPQWWSAIAAVGLGPLPANVAMVGAAITWPGGLEAWMQHMLILSPALAFAPTSLRRSPAFLIYVAGAIAAAVVLHRWVGNVAVVALWLGTAAWFAATMTAFSLEQMGTHWLMRVEVPVAALVLAVLAARWHVPSHAMILSVVMVVLAVGSWLWMGRQLRWLGAAAVLAGFGLAFAATKEAPLIARAALAQRPILWPTDATDSGETPPRFVRAKQLFDDTAPIDAALRRAHHSMQDGMGAGFGAANLTAGAAFDSRLAEVIQHGAASMGQVIDRLGIEFAIIPTSALVATGLVAVARYDDWSMVRTQPSRPRWFVTSTMDAYRGDQSLREVFPTGPARHGIAFVALDVATMGWRDMIALVWARAYEQLAPQPIGACAIDGAAEAPQNEFALRCRHAAPGLAVILDAWAPGWQVTVNGVAGHPVRGDGVVRAVFVEGGETFVVWRYEPTGWPVARALWWGGVFGLLLLWVRKLMDRW